MLVRVIHEACNAVRWPWLAFFGLFGLEVWDFVARPELLQVVMSFEEVEACDELVCQLAKCQLAEVEDVSA